jgi:hypothetical protein
MVSVGARGGTRVTPVAFRSALAAAVVGIAAAAIAGAQSAGTLGPDRIWFSPNPGTLDMRRMFEQPDQWRHTRALVSVYNFTQQHTFAVPDPIVGPNSYDALVAVDAFRKLKQWGKKISLGVGAVKEFYCTDDASGMNRSTADTLQAMTAITRAGGEVAYLSMDEPWVSGRARRCGGPALEPTADRVAFYMSAVQRAQPAVKIGLIEAYPFSSADAIETMLNLLQARGVQPGFLHMDVDWHALKAGDFTRDMKQLQAVCRARKMPFGIIITGYNGDADALFAADAYGIARLIAQTFPTWADMPDHLMWDSWVESSTGLRITPANLPDDRPYTQTNLLWDIFRYLRGATAPGTAGAIRR